MSQPRSTLHQARAGITKALQMCITNGCYIVQLKYTIRRIELRVLFQPVCSFRPQPILLVHSFLQLVFPTSDVWSAICVHSKLFSHAKPQLSGMTS